MNSCLNVFAFLKMYSPLVEESVDDEVVSVELLVELDGETKERI